MKGFSLLALATACFLGQHSCNGRATLNPFPFGTIGCLVSDVCGSGEVCTNDLLFGSCQNIFTRALSGEIKFHLERGEPDRLEKVIRKLLKRGFTWKDAFTQCTLQNTLLEFSRGRLFDPNKCGVALGVSSTDVTDDMNEEIANVLLELLERGDLDLEDLERMAIEDQPGDLLNSHKRDEFVQVHKYFDKSKGQLKRDPYFYQEDPSSEYFYMPSEEGDSTIGDTLDTYYDRSQPQDSDEESSIGDSLASYSQPGQSEPDSTIEDRIAAYYAESQPNDALSEQSEFPTFKTEDQIDSMESSPLSRFADIESGSQDTSLADQPFVNDQFGSDSATVNQIDDTQSMEARNSLKVSEEDERTLEKLLDGSIQPEDLDSGQQERMEFFIEKLIKVLEESPEPVEETLQPMEEEPTESPTDDKEVVDAESDEGQDSTPSATEEEMDKKSVNIIYPQAGAQGVEQRAPMDASESKDQKERNKEKIDSHSMYLLLNKEVDTPTGVMFMDNLTKALDLPLGVFGLIQVGPDKLISLEVSGDQDVETIAKNALRAKNELKKLTDIEVVKAGIGSYDNGVEVKQNNRYVVLTFILVGSIAGVMLAVVTIYLIKRHTRSKQKLEQLASNPDGTEASKDYQDLCRQRMQGKTSEKPEPLHAASRIGSTSESQVRSPSSRSSTSSWSEEPAATNMDISTGHIVLSYMEDHLKNQNRLDKEWEAVSSYVADPSSTKVATDQSNMRKNRFADILPYDHSRVVLSSNANVANSDYINASFITDHDPRNPAYICTQGPLPHTVADFWQMIWEQGSVVIVMLTKLAENGTGLCHRYWPEEGSDLYHIYEVHLVSEHIWCDDYLVRSFYLKNLQTNETRTVTQFHFLTWPQLSVPASIKTLLDFRRKVNKSFRGRSCPIVVHCSDGCGRSGTYCLVDMVLNKMAKGAKEIDMAATLEHIRDQRMSTVKTKEQFQFSLAAVAEEVHAILKALPQ